MDLICLIIGCICCARHSLMLAVVAIVLGMVEVLLLIWRDRPWNIAYVAAIFALVSGVYKCCTI